MPTVNEAIVTTLRPFILSQVRLVEAVAQSNGLGVRTGQVPVFLEDGGVRPFHRILPDPASMLRSLSSSWRTKPQFQAVHRTWMANAQLSAILSAVQAPPEQVLIMILNNFLADYLEEAIPLHPHYWSEDIFQRLVSVLAEDVHTGRYVVYLWMPAYNVSVTDGCSITLEPGVDLTHPPEDDWVRLTTGVQLFGYPLWQSQRWFVKYEQHSVFNEPVAMTVPPRVQGLLGGMRLVGGGNPKVHEVMMLPRRGGLRTAPGMGAGASLLTTPLGGRKCEISGADLIQIRHYADLIPAFEQVFPAATRRWLTANQRLDPEDMLIDTVIALESLLLVGESQELAHKFALRGAWLLAGTKTDRAGYFNRFKTVYEARSRVVHGDPLKTNLEKIAVDAATLLQQVLMRLLDGKYTRAQWRSHLDALVLGWSPGVPPITDATHGGPLS